MAYTNSPLATVTILSPNHSGKRSHAIDTITIHCVVGQCSAETIGNIFSSKSRQASSNYGIGFDGKIGLYVEEKNRSWCSSSATNDNRAITIEVASDTTEPYAVTDKAYAALIDLVTDICKRNNIKELKWKADKSLIGKVDKQNMTVHRWFANKSCPGTYLYDRHSQIAAEVNKRLSGKDTPTTVAVKAGNLVKISSNAKYYTGAAVPSWVKKLNWYVDSVSGDRAVLGKSEDGKYNIVSPISTTYLTVVKPTTVAKPQIKVGSTVKLKEGAKTYDGKSLASFVHKRNHKVKEIKGDRVVITYIGIVIAAVKLSDLVLVK